MDQNFFASPFDIFDPDGFDFHETLTSNTFPPPTPMPEQIEHGTPLKIPETPGVAFPIWERHSSTTQEQTQELSSSAKPGHLLQSESCSAYPPRFLPRPTSHTQTLATDLHSSFSSLPDSSLSTDSYQPDLSPGEMRLASPLQQHHQGAYGNYGCSSGHIDKPETNHGIHPKQSVDEQNETHPGSLAMISEAHNKSSSSTLEFDTPSSSELKEADNPKAPLVETLDDFDQISDCDPNDRLTRLRKPMNAYLLFCKDYREQFREQHQFQNTTELAALMGRLWKMLPDDVRQYYKVKARELYKKFMQDHPMHHMRRMERGVQMRKMMSTWKGVFPANPSAS